MDHTYGYLYAEDDTPPNTEELFGKCDAVITDKTRERKKLNSLLRTMQAQDVLVVEDLHALGDSSYQILQRYRKITEEKQVQVRVLEYPLLDTTSTEKNIEFEQAAKCLLEVLKSVSSGEARTRKKIQKKGFDKARENGVTFGRPPKPKPEGYEEIAQDWKDRKINSKDAAAKLGVCQNTFLKWVSQEKAEEEKKKNKDSKVLLFD